MPRNRSDVARDEKIAELVDAGRRRLLDGGYEALSVAAIARELGLAQAAVYWYFPSKDHLLVAVVERILHDVLERKPRRGTQLDHVLWFTERLGELHDVRTTVRDRARSSEVVAAFARDVDQLLRALLAGALSTEVDAPRLDDTVDAVMALCEGALLRDVGPHRRREIVRFGYQRLLS